MSFSKLINQNLIFSETYIACLISKILANKSDTEDIIETTLCKFCCHKINFLINGNCKKSFKKDITLKYELIPHPKAKEIKQFEERKNYITSYIKKAPKLF